MFPSPSPSPSPSPGPAFLYPNSHGHHQSGSHGSGAGAGAGSGAGSGANGASSHPFGPLNGVAGGAGYPVPRMPAGAAGWGLRSHPSANAHHQQNASLSSLSAPLAHSSAASSMNANGGPPSPGYASMPGHHHPHHPSQQQHHPHHPVHSAHAQSHLSHIPSPGQLHPGSSTTSSHLSSSVSPASMAAASGSPHWQQQLVKAEISRQSASPHHHARAAALAARSATSAAVAIQDPNKAALHIPQTAANGLHLNSRKEGQSDETAAVNGDGTATDGKANSKDGGKGSKQSWSTIDMGGLGLRNLSKELYRYDFLTSLFINHNSLSTLSPEIIHLKHLTILDASGNKLTNLPAEMGMLRNLKELYLFDNQLVTLPPEFGGLFNLELLGIEGNPMAENIRTLIQREGTAAAIAFLRDSCPVPLPPPEREWITIEPDLPPARSESEGPEPPTETLNLLSYNVLCDKYATQAMYGYTPSWALAWDYRKEFILQEVMSYGADVCCLQEVVAEQYEDYFLHHLSQQDYEGVYWPKSRARTMRDDEKKRVDGCATFYKTSKYALIEKQLIEFNQIALQRPDFKKTEDMFNRVMTKDNIAVVTLLENKESGSRLVVANVHIHWDPEFSDVKMVQVAMLMDELEKVTDRFAKFPAKLNVAEGYPAAPKYTSGTQIPTIICGDFNSEPSSGVYDFLSQGAVPGNHKDFMSRIYGNYTAHGLSHKLPLKSAYANIGELPFTNYTPGFEGVIDHIWYNQNALAVTGLLGEVEKTYLNKVVGFPNAHFPSDHICILSEFRVKHPREAPARKPVDFGGGQSRGGDGGGGHYSRR